MSAMRLEATLGSGPVAVTVQLQLWRRSPFHFFGEEGGPCLPLSLIYVLLPLSAETERTIELKWIAPALFKGIANVWKFAILALLLRCRCLDWRNLSLICASFIEAIDGDLGLDGRVADM